MPSPVCLFLPACLVAADLCIATEQDGSNNTSPPKINFDLRPGEIVGSEQVVRQLVEVDSFQYLFMLPQDLRSETGAASIVLTSSDMTFHVTLRVVPNPPGGFASQESLKTSISSRYPGASNMDEFATRVADRDGLGCQFEHSDTALGVTRFVRILRVALKAGAMEFVLDSDMKSAAAAQAAMDVILLTFQSNENGPIDVMTRSEQT